MTKRILFAVLIAVLSGNFLGAQITFTVQATANSTGYGYTDGLNYTFVFQTGGSYPNASTLSANSVFLGTDNLWIEEEVSENSLFLGVTGTGLQGTFARSASPYSYVGNESGGRLILRVGRDYGASGNIGLSALDSTMLSGINFNIPDVLLSSPAFSGSFSDPVGYWASHVGNYLPVDSGRTLWLEDTSDVVIMDFTPTSVTVAAVPEPTTMALGLGVAVLGLALVRRRRVRSGVS
jgi:MYXO-CTERM domain-containing protein